MAVVVGLAACGGGAPGTTPAPTPTPGPTSLQQALDQARESTGVPAAAAAILEDGRVVFESASGNASLAPDRPAGATTLFSLASVTKMATSVVVLRLMEQRRLSLEETLAGYVPYLPNADRITLRMLLSHRSGLADYLGNPDIQRKLADPSHALTRDEVLRAVGRVLFEPGARYEYSNTSFVALGAVIERVSGRSVEQAFDDLVATPLGLERSFFAFDAAVAPDVAHGYRFGGGRYTDTFPADGRVPTAIWGPVWTDGGLVCSAGDTARWTDAALGGRLLRPETLAQMTAFGPEGYGLGVVKSIGGGREVWGHNGAYDGYGRPPTSIPRGD